MLNIIVASSELVGWAQDSALKSKMGTVAPRGHARFFSSLHLLLHTNGLMKSAIKASGTLIVPSGHRKNGLKTG